MQRADVLRSLAEAGYNVGFGAKKHLATFDIVGKVPGFVSFVAILFGILGLVWEVLAEAPFAAALTVLGVIGVYVTSYDEKKSEYAVVGQELTNHFNRLRDLYRTAKACPDEQLEEISRERRGIENELTRLAISRQILFSDWYAHYKFFWQHQIDWIDEQKQFRLFRDKLPLTLMLAVAAITLIVAFGAYEYWDNECFVEGINSDI